MLKETEWLTINNVLLELYAQEDFACFAQKLMHVIRMLIPYSKGYLLLRNGSRIDEQSSYFLGMTQREIDAYLHVYYQKDYLQYFSDMMAETSVYRDTDIMEESLRHKTAFYQEFLRQADIPYGCGILVKHDGEVCAVFNLFRNSHLGNFTARDLEVLNIMKKHIENMIVHVLAPMRTRDLGSQVRAFARAYQLTSRESEVLELVADGLSNQEICQRLVISISTVKKHIYNLYVKTKVRSRTQLIHLLMKGRYTKGVEEEPFDASEAI